MGSVIPRLASDKGLRMLLIPDDQSQCCLWRKDRQLGFSRSLIALVRGLALVRCSIVLRIGSVVCLPDTAGREEGGSSLRVASWARAIVDMELAFP